MYPIVAASPVLINFPGGYILPQAVQREHLFVDSPLASYMSWWLCVEFVIIFCLLFSIWRINTMQGNAGMVSKSVYLSVPMHCNKHQCLDDTRLRMAWCHNTVDMCV